MNENVGAKCRASGGRKQASNGDKMSDERVGPIVKGEKKIHYVRAELDTRQGAAGRNETL